ncbi:MAG TPA: 6-hydroxymethylpterin diphosphokinase MptE-like protein [Acidobacteriota bacterium]|nr:6-hydroxymethylpterin diphosphokinase MptE-like protein [Acidobacteriota bacterium]
MPTASCDHDSSTHALHSKYDPLKEARQALKKNDYGEANYFIFLGFGLGYILDALIEETADPSIHCFVVESDLEILRAAFEARDLSHILSLPHLHFAWPASGAELAEQWDRFFDPVQAQKSTFITHYPSISLNPAFFRAAAEKIQSQIFQTYTDINTLVAKSQTFLDNFVQNLPKAARAPGLAKFAGAFPGVPAIIVSAGPSLDKNIHELRGIEDRALIISTDTALKPLLAAGIDPHFVMTGDPSHANYLHIKGAPSRESFLVAEATSYPDVFGEFIERTLTCTFENSALHSLSDLLGNKGILRAWGSVATMALDFALWVGCRPIIFIGQDLAHTDGRIYCTGLNFDDQWFAGVTDPAAWQKAIEEMRSHKRAVMIEDIFGRPVESTDKLTSYWNWMTKECRDHPEVQFINATEGGILRDNVNVMSFREAIYRFCDKNLDLRPRIRNAFSAAQENNLLYVGVNLAVIKGELAALRDVLHRGSQLCGMDAGYSAQELRKRLEATKDAIYYHPHLAPLMDSLNQMGNFNFLRRRRSILQRPPDSENLRDEIKNTYAEYFGTVGEALDMIGHALSRIEANFDAEPLP